MFRRRTPTESDARAAIFAAYSLETMRNGDHLRRTFAQLGDLMIRAADAPTIEEAEAACRTLYPNQYRWAAERVRSGAQSDLIGNHYVGYHNVVFPKVMETWRREARLSHEIGKVFPTPEAFYRVEGICFLSLAQYMDDDAWEFCTEKARKQVAADPPIAAFVKVLEDRAG